MGEDETPPLHEGPDLEQFRDIRGLDYSPPSPRCRLSRRGMKRDENKEAYKLPHRLIEKKRRDRINECISQLKDLLPEQLKLTTLGHLEKAVVLELTLKHVKTLTALTEQQHQKIVALQNGARSPESPPHSDLQAFHSGFQTCTKEAVRYLSRGESWAGREQRCVQLLGHLRAVCARSRPGSPLSIPKLGGAPQGRRSPQEGPQPQKPRPGGTPKQDAPQPHCVPVIQRTQNWGRGAANPQRPPSGPEPAGEPDTDTDSGYGGETPQAAWRVKQEPVGDGQEEEAPQGGKRRRLEHGSPSATAGQRAGVGERPGPALLHPLGAWGPVGGSAGDLRGSLLAQAAPSASFCLPFYLVAPSAYLQPFLEKISLERGAAGPFPFLYPGIAIQGAAATAFPFLAGAAGEGGSLSGAAGPGFPREGGPATQPPPRLNAETGPPRPCPKLGPQPGRGESLQREALRPAFNPPGN